MKEQGGDGDSSQLCSELKRNEKKDITTSVEHVKTWSAMKPMKNVQMYKIKEKIDATVFCEMMIGGT